MDIFGGSSQNWASLRVIGILGQVRYLIVSIPDLYTLTYFHFYASRVFFKVKVQNWDLFVRLLHFQIFFGVLEIPDICWGKR